MNMMKISTNLSSMKNTKNGGKIGQNNLLDKNNGRRRTQVIENVHGSLLYDGNSTPTTSYESVLI